MRGMLPDVIRLIFLVISVLAAENGAFASDFPADSKTDSDAIQYAQNLDYTINAIIEDYVRPVSRAEPK